MKGMLEYSPCLHFAMFQSLCLVLILPTFSDLMVRGWYWFHFIITCTLFHVSECSKSSNSARNKQQFEKCEYVSGNIFLSIIMKLSEFSEYSLPKSSEVCRKQQQQGQCIVSDASHMAPPSPSCPLLSSPVGMFWKSLWVWGETDPSLDTQAIGSQAVTLLTSEEPSLSLEVGFSVKRVRMSYLW